MLRSLILKGGVGLTMGLTLALTFSACGPVQFSKKPDKGCGIGEVCYLDGGSTIEQNFLINGGTNKVDILFVVDNSGSMTPEQTNLGNRFSTFVSRLVSGNGTGLDWQIGITTTNVCASPGVMYDGENVGSGCPQQGVNRPSNFPEVDWESSGAQGSLLALNGASGKIITPSTINADAVFKNTVQRPLSQTGSGDERPYAAAHLAIDKRGSQNSGFWRSQSAFALVILTDEDERSTGGANGEQIKDYDKPDHLIAHVASQLGADKSFVIHTINIRKPIPGTSNADQACLDSQRSQTPFLGSGNFGALVQTGAALTGGKIIDVCLPDYSASLEGIAGQIVAQTNSITLARPPIPGSVEVRYKRPQDSDWKTASQIGIQETLNGTTISFNPPPPAGTTVRVRYAPLSGSQKVTGEGTPDAQGVTTQSADPSM